MQIEKNELVQIIQTVVETTIKNLESRGLLGSANASSKRGSASANSEKTAYQQTEQLLYNYNNFKKIIAERLAEIEDIKKYGAPQRGAVVVQYSGDTRKPKGFLLDEERVEAAIRKIEDSMESTVQAVALIDKCMATMQTDPYYKILEMRYFEGRTQEDIALEFSCTQANISYNKSRLIKELSIKLFPDKVVNELTKK